MSDSINILDVTTVSESQLPLVISTQFDNLNEIEKNVKKAVDLAIQAKEKAQGAQVSAGAFKKKTAIELLQGAVQGNAEAQISIVDAQKLLFEYQAELTKITKYLFCLGVSNIAMNRSVVRELEKKLKGASEEEISDLAKQELRDVILQLKAQEDMMKKQEFLTGKVKEQAGKIKSIDDQLDKMEEVDDKQYEKIAENTATLAEHDEEIEQQKQKDAEHDKRFVEMDKTDDEQDVKIAENAATLAEHDDELEKQKQKTLELEKLLEQQKIIDEELRQQVLELKRRVESIELFNSKIIWKIGVTTIAVISLIINILHIIGII